MLTTEERVDRLETVMIELAEAQMRTQVSLKTLSDEMKDFKDEMGVALKTLSDEMTDFKDEMKGFKDEMTDFKDEMKDFKDEMTDFKDEMKDFKDEVRADRKQMNEQLGELVNKWGTLVEDIVAPNIPRIAREHFGFSDIEFFAVRVKVRNKKDQSKQREFDVIAVGETQVIINETKSMRWRWGMRRWSSKTSNK